jgi:hypothetical protein
METTKACLYCGEEILAVAVKCKHCGSMLDGSIAAPAGVQASAAKPAPDLGSLLLAIPLLAVLLIWFWIPSIPMIQGPGSSLQLVVIATVVLTGAIAAFEARGSGVAPSRKDGTYSPFAWFVLMLLFWIVTYPYYLAKRKKYGLKSRVMAGLVVAILFVGSTFVISSAITDKQIEIQAAFGQIGK